jgi:diguanylate cyclase (GGDEF)-like protein
LDELFPLTLLISLVFFVLRRWRDSICFSQMAEQKASKYSLTKLVNWRTLESTLGTEWDLLLRYNEDFCVVLFDIDDFSATNENLGYVEGDRVLIEAATMWLNTTCKTDFCARWGEEAFMILCPVCKSEQATLLAEKLRSNLYRTLKDGVELSASFAVAQSDKTTSLEELMKRVDSAST